MENPSTSSGKEDELLASRPLTAEEKSILDMFPSGGLGERNVGSQSLSARSFASRQLSQLEKGK